MISRLRTEEERKRIERRKQYIIGGVLIVLMVLSTLGFALIGSDNGTDSSVEDMGVKFVRENGLWNFKMDGQSYVSQNLPSSLLDVKINGSFYFSDYVNKPLYLVNPDSQSASVLLSVLSRYFLRYQQACISEDDCEGDLPVKSCSDNVIVFVPGNETRLWREENCVFLEGDLVKAADAFLYKALNIL